MLRRDDEGNESESRPIRFPKKAKPVTSKANKHPKRPAALEGGLAPDAKRYNDDIPDPDSEEIVPE